MLEIDNIEVVAPSKFKVSIMDISKAERNAKGEMHIDRIATKRKLEVSWNALYPEQLQALLTQVSNVFFLVSYPDPLEGYTTKTFYVGDRNTPMYSYINGEAVWKDISMNFVEQ